MSHTQIELIPLILGMMFSFILLVVTVIIVWPSMRAEERTGVPLQGVSLLEVTSLDNARVASQLTDVNINDMVVRSPAGMFMVMVVDGQLVPVEDDDPSHLPSI